MTTDRKPAFADRQREDLSQGLDLDAARKRLLHAHALANRFASAKVVQRASTDAWHRWIWGSDFASLIAHYWTLAQKAEDVAAARAFPAQVSSAVRQLWFGDGRDRPGLRTVFPEQPRPVRKRPSKITDVQWPKIEGTTHDPRMFPDVTKSSERAAATLLLSLLRNSSRGT